MNQIQNNRTVTQLSVTNTAVQPPDVDAAPIGAPNEEKAATFDRAPAKRASIFAPHAGGDSRVVSPAGGGTGEVNNNEAIDGHSKNEGDFTESRTLGGKTLFLTPEGARAVDAMLQRAEASSAPVRAESDPDFFERFFMGDSFAGRELFSGETEK